MNIFNTLLLIVYNLHNFQNSLTNINLNKTFSLSNSKNSNLISCPDDYSFLYLNFECFNQSNIIEICGETNSCFLNHSMAIANITCDTNVTFKWVCVYSALSDASSYSNLTIDLAKDSHVPILNRFYGTFLNSFNFKLFWLL